MSSSIEIDASKTEKTSKTKKVSKLKVEDLLGQGAQSGEETSSTTDSASNGKGVIETPSETQAATTASKKSSKETEQPESKKGDAKKREQPKKISFEKEKEIAELAKQVRRLNPEEKALFWEQIEITPMQADVFTPGIKGSKRVFFSLDETMRNALNPVFLALYQVTLLRKSVGKFNMAATPRLARFLRDTQRTFDKRGREANYLMFHQLNKSGSLMSAIYETTRIESEFFGTDPRYRKGRKDLARYRAESSAFSSDDFDELLIREYRFLLRLKKEKKLGHHLVIKLEALREHFGEILPEETANPPAQPSAPAEIERSDVSDAVAPQDEPISTSVSAENTIGNDNE